MLGYIPDWQFSADPKVNPYVNPHVSMPAGMMQAGTVQPTYGPNTFGPISGLAGTEASLIGPLCQKNALGLCGKRNGHARNGAARNGRAVAGLGYVMIDESPLGFVESWWYRNRKPIVLTTLGVGVLAALGLASMLR